MTSFQSQCSRSADNRAKARACFAAGRLQLKMNKCSAAEMLFGQALYFDSTVSLYHYYQGLAQEKQCRMKDARWAFERALCLDPYNAKNLAKLNLVCRLSRFEDKHKGVFKMSSMGRPHRRSATKGQKRSGD